ncbi:hypothetical protein GEMRC1_008547 [Eukaryota sp. GEM-RC1]
MLSTSLPDELHKRTDDLVSVLQPTRSSDEHRAAVVKHISVCLRTFLYQNLIFESVGGHVFQFGSVPLKTYLPDADIDIGCFVKGITVPPTHIRLYERRILVVPSSSCSE